MRKDLERAFLLKEKSLKAYNNLYGERNKGFNFVLVFGFLFLDSLLSLSRNYPSLLLTLSVLYCVCLIFGTLNSKAKLPPKVEEWAVAQRTVFPLGRPPHLPTTKTSSFTILCRFNSVYFFVIFPRPTQQSFSVLFGIFSFLFVGYFLEYFLVEGDELTPHIFNAHWERS